MKEIERKLTELIELCAKTEGIDSKGLQIILLTAKGSIEGGLMPILVSAVVECSVEVLLPLITDIQQAQKAKMN